MIYTCEVSLSLDQAVQQFDAEGLKYKVVDECTLFFRKKPCRREKEILSRCGFTLTPQTTAPSREALEALKGKFS